MSAKKKKSQKQSQSIQIVEQSLFQDGFAKISKSQKNPTKSAVREKKQFSAVAELLSNHPIRESNKYISQEFQAYGCHMATVLGDQAHTSLYIKLAKTYPRALLERALAFVSDAENARSKAKLFMWKLDQLKKKKEANVINKKQQARKN